MFGFMKKSSEKDREEKERKKKEKKEKKLERKASKTDKDKHVMSPEDLQRLEEAKKGVFRRFSDAARGRGSVSAEGIAVAYREPAEGPTPSDSSENSSLSSPSIENLASGKYTSQKNVELQRPTKPAIAPKPNRGILKGKSHYGPTIPNQGVQGALDDTVTLEQNTMLNEIMSGNVPEVNANGDAKSSSKSRKSSGKSSPSKSPNKLNMNYKPVIPTFDVPPPPATSPPRELFSPPSPSEKTFGDEDLQLPSVAPPRCPKPREISLKRLSTGDFGFTLRRGTIIERGAEENNEIKKVVIFAEPGAKNNQTGLLPGDRLVEINDKNVEGLNREEVIDIIRNSGDSVTLQVQPIPELSELSLRTGIDGGEVPIAATSLNTGTLQRSGSMRFKSKQAKSEAQLASEKAWLSAEKVWLVHKGGFTGASAITSEADSELPEGRCKVKIDYNGKILEVDEEDVEKANPPQFDRVEDLAGLRYLNESSVLHTMRQRYGSNLIHTYGGQTLLLINPMHQLSIYSDKVIQMFRGCRQEDMPPHIYASAQMAYRSMLASRRDQSIVLMGRSGSGKTASARHVLHYLTYTAGSVNGHLTVEKLQAVFTLLDAFGNSRTIMNTSASKYTSITSLDFDHSGQIAAASVQVLMLEKMRLVKRPEGEPCFHVFYQMLAGMDSQLRNDLQLQNLSEPNMFMTPLQRPDDRQRATQAWGKIHSAMTQLAITDAEERALLAILAAIYHLGVAAVAKGGNNKFQFGRPAAAQRAAAVLGTTVENLSHTIFTPPPQSQPRTPVKGGSGTLERDRGAAEGLHGVEALEGFVVGLYSEAFNALVSLINRSLSSSYRSISSIIVVDTPGFQNAASCGRTGGSTFEDFCHNYAQERLQLLFHDTVFTSQQDLYAQENIECDFPLVMTSPQPLVSLIDKTPQQNVVRGRDDSTELRGLLWLLDEEAIYPGGSSEGFITRLFNTHGSNPERRGSLLRRCPEQGHFLLNHFQGTNPVVYSAKDWLKSCRENPVSRQVNVFLQDSKREELSALFTNVRGPVSTMMGGSVTGIEGSSSLRRASSIRRSYVSGTAGLKRKSVCLQVKFQVDSVVDTIRRTKLHFVHCLLPQHNAGLCDLRTSLPNKENPSEDIMLNVPLVRSQIRGAEIVEAIRIHRQGFPEHMLFSDFRHRFEILAPVEVKPVTPVVDEKQACENLLGHLDIEKSQYRLGLSQVFFRAGGLAQLEDQRDEKVTGTIVAFQAHCRRYLIRQKVKKLKVMHIAAGCIQRNVRKFMAIREWPWWRLYTRIQPLLNVRSTEEQLQAKELELEQLKLKLDKLEKERNDYKHTSDKLETKLSEMTADFTEVHSTSTHATDMLEAETVARMKLEKELKEIQTKYSNLQRKHEMTEMDLMHTRLLASSLEGELEDDEGDGDSVYRERFQRAKREIDFLKKKMEEQQEEFLEQQDSLRKNMERKLHESQTETEEQRRQMNNFKRKSQRQIADMSDVKLHLEEQCTRNSELEKKQRKFDSELQKVSTLLKDEKTHREKIQREKDQISAENYQATQELKEVKMDYDLQREKLERLERELTEISTSSGSKEDKDTAALKRVKQEYEVKLQEQEEELDDQAGTIQQLEQAKLRLEMTQEKTRQQHLREMEEREQEMEELRASTQKKVRTLESQLEEEYTEKQSALKDKRELERRLKDVVENETQVNRDTEKRLRRDLKRTRALLHDAQMMLDKQKEGAASRSTVKQLRNQLEDAEYATAAAVKARKGLEQEVSDLQQQLDSIQATKQQSEDRAVALGRDKCELQSQLEENDEEMAELMKKYKAAVQQSSVDTRTLMEQSKQIEELMHERQLLQEQVTSLQSSLEYLQASSVDKQTLVRLEAKLRDFESRLELETTSKQRAETQLQRVKEQCEKLTEERAVVADAEQRHGEETKRLTRQMRDLREELAESERKEEEAGQRKHQLDLKVESLEGEFAQSQADLRLAFQRIADLQAVIEDDMDSDDSEYYTDADDVSSDEDSDSDGDYDSHLVNHQMSTIHEVPGGVQSIELNNVDASEC